MMVIVHNGNPGSTAKLINDDSWTFEFDLPWGATIKPTSLTVLVNSASGTLTAADFRLTWHSGQPRIAIQFASSPKHFPPGEGFGFLATFQAPAGPAFGMVAASGSSAAKRLAPIVPSFTPVAFLAPPPTTNVPPGTSVNVGGGSTVNVGNNSNVTTGSGSTVNAGPGSTVVVSPGTNVVLPPGTNVSTPSSSLPSGPNFLQIAALKWYEAAGTQRITLSGPPEALVFDGRYVWTVLSGMGRLARIEPPTGAVIEVTLTGLTNPNRALQAIVFDGEQFWVSGPVDGVVSDPTGTLLPDTLPPCAPRCLTFDGTSVWGAAGGNIFQISRSAAGQLATGMQFSTGGYPPVGLVFDGTNLWIASAAGSVGQLLSIRADTGQVSLQQSLAYAPGGLVFDGQDLWLTDSYHHVVEKRGRDGSLIGRYSTGLQPTSLLFDGAHVWVANRYGSSVTKLRAIDGVVIGTFATDPEPIALAFDGINIWAASSLRRSLTRL